jgi:ATP-dependent Clp protease ATP-binding subunit ClpA
LGTVNQRWKISSGQGDDPQFGARPLKRAIQEHLLAPLAVGRRV